MTDDATEAQKRVNIELQEEDYFVVPGGRISIPFEIHNLADQEDFYEIRVVGLQSDWVKLSASVVQLPAEGREMVELVIELPFPPQARLGRYPFTIRAISQKTLAQEAEASLRLTIAAATNLQGRIGMLVESVNFTISPGTRFPVPIILVNTGIVEDSLRLSVEGIPASWVSTPTPVVRLSPGEEREVILSILPPRATQSRAGRYTIKVRAFSQGYPDPVVEVECRLTLSTFSHFVCELHPPRTQAGQPIMLQVRNEGNFKETFQISFQGDMLIEPEQISPMNIQPGETGTIEFSARPSQPQWIGGEATYAYSVQVQSSARDTKTLNGEVTARAWVPIWVLPIVLLICLAVVCSIAVFVNQQIGQITSPTKTFSAQLTVVAATMQFTPGGDQTQAAQTVIAQATIASGQTAVAILTQQAIGSLTPLPPTNTSIPAPTVTWTLTPLPTEAPRPTSTSQPSPTTPAGPTLTPEPPIRNTGRIAFESFRNGNSDPYILYTDDFRVIQLINSTAVDTQPAWSPDASKLAFSSNMNGNNEIYIMNSDGSGLVNLTNHPANDQYPCWSPDGQSIAFATDRDGNVEIYIMRADGSQPINLTNSPAEDTQPHWFLDRRSLVGTGEWIAFTSNRDGNQEIYMIRPDATSIYNATAFSSSNDFYAAAHPNGDKLAFVSNRDGNLEIYTMNLDGSAQINITNNPSADQFPWWSPNGDWIVFTTNRTGNNEVFIIRTNGTEPYNLTNNPAVDQYPTWR